MAMVFVEHRPRGRSVASSGTGMTSVKTMGKVCDVYARMEALDAFSAHDNQFEFLD
jgi:hypothetical protein